MSIKNDFASRFFRSWSQSTRESIQNHDILVPIHRHFLKVTSASKNGVRREPDCLMVKRGKSKGREKETGDLFQRKVRMKIRLGRRKRNPLKPSTKKVHFFQSMFIWKRTFLANLQCQWQKFHQAQTEWVWINSAEKWSNSFDGICQLQGPSIIHMMAQHCFQMLPGTFMWKRMQSSQRCLPKWGASSEWWFMRLASKTSKKKGYVPWEDMAFLSSPNSVTGQFLKSLPPFIPASFTKQIRASKLSNLALFQPWAGVVGWTSVLEFVGGTEIKQIAWSPFEPRNLFLRLKMAVNS